MRQYLWIGAALGLLVLSASKTPLHAQEAPNIVLFLVDDMGWNDTSVEFAPTRSVWNDLYATPNMQRLADQGMKFTNAYSASPVCSPTRASIMTGMNPGRSRISDWVRQTGGGGNANTYVRSPSWKSQGIQPGDGITTLPTVLKANGYRTAHVGKAHFGSRNVQGGNDPTNVGFDINIGGSEIGGPFSYFSPWISNPSLYPNLSQYGSGQYITDVLTVEANQIINDAVNDSTPFFINMAHYAVHAPIGGQGDPDFLPAYQNANRPNPEDDYAAMLESMDASLGAILDNLEQQGVADNTIVMFMSDNGGLSNHTRNFGGTQTVQTLGGDNLSVSFQRDKHNLPINSGKGSGYEGGIRVPMIVAWAGQESGQSPINPSLPIVPGSTSAVPVISDDFFPTILNMARVQNITQYTEDGQGNRIIDGENLTPVLRGDAFTRDDAIYIHYPHQWYQNIGVGEGIEPFTAIRDGDWKAIYFYGDGIADGNGSDPRWELYNLVDDLGEQNNLIVDESAVASVMRDKLHRGKIPLDFRQIYFRSCLKAIPMNRASR